MIPFVIAFICATVVSLLIMPLISKIALRFRILDIPTSRKVHTRPIPRIGGVGIFISFLFVVVAMTFLYPDIIQRYFSEPNNLLVAFGALIAFGVGLVDDLKRLRARYKLIVQVIAAMFACAGGVCIESIGIQGVFLLNLDSLSPLVSIFWIILVINAINLIDGLDGLAAGICLFSTLFLCYICVVGGRSGLALLMIILSGSLLGFLRYNFNPATIFMGDGGSYFLGYMLAVTSVLVAVDNQTAFTVLIPMLALGLPIIDVSIATVRRFLLGQNIFRPDKKHFHHMLLQKGVSHRNTVLLLYVVAIITIIATILLMKMHDEKSLAMMVFFGLVVIFGIYKLGYFRNYDRVSILRWLSGIGDEAGLTNERRSFFNIQIQINESDSLNDLWKNVEKALVMMGFVICNVYLTNRETIINNEDLLKTKKQGETFVNRRKTSVICSTVTLRKSPPDWHWVNPEMETDQHSRSLFRVEMDMQGEDGNSLGTLVLIKDQRLSPIGHYTLKRIEHLRRSITKALISTQTAQDLPV